MKTNLEHYLDNISQNDDLDCYVATLRNGKDCGKSADCKTCLINTFKWLAEEYKEPIQMTLFEKSILECAMNRGFEYIARDRGGELYVHSERPCKGKNVWVVYTGVSVGMALFDDKFQFIKWDDEPVHILTLLKEAEVKGE